MFKAMNYERLIRHYDVSAQDVSPPAAVPSTTTIG